MSGVERTYVTSAKELHDALCDRFMRVEQDLFRGNIDLMRQAIERKIWRDMGHKTFSDWVLCLDTTGLAVHSNERLWMLRCTLDVDGAHAEVWAELLDRVDAIAKKTLKDAGRTQRDYNSKSLENIAKDDGSSPIMSWVPSWGGGQSSDTHLLKLHRKDPKSLKQIASGKKTLLEVRRELGDRIDNATRPQKAQSALRLMERDEQVKVIMWAVSEMDKRDRAKLIAWMKAENFIKEPAR